MSRIGHFMHTRTGKFWPLDPRAEDVNIEDIAHALAYQCRFNGATREFYSVAEHCVHCSFIGPESEALERLLHDASEAYTGDLIRPIKRSEVLDRLHPELAEHPVVLEAKRLSEAYVAIESRVETIVAERFRLQYPWPASVKFADEALVNAELDALFDHGDHGICSDPTVRAPVELQCWAPMDAKAVFLHRFHELTYAREIGATWGVEAA